MVTHEYLNIEAPAPDLVCTLHYNTWKALHVDGQTLFRQEQIGASGHFACEYDQSIYFALICVQVFR